MPFRIRGRTRDPKTRERREVNRALPDCKRASEAAAIARAELAKIAAGEAPVQTSALRFADWAVTVLERKLAIGAIVSAAGHAKWDWALRVHLIPAFGQILVDKLTRAELVAPAARAASSRM
ncbi:MAG: hypothetical protein SFX73_00655 [Kofleriaceae bacterium]|nr:hypothetical protein [Kofleriaceae bacterium]